MPILKKINGHLIVTGAQIPLADNLLLENGETLEISLKIADKRNISDRQRKFIFKLCEEVESYSGLDKELFRAQAMVQNVRQNEVEKASLTEYSMSDANKLIDIIIDYCVDNSIPLAKHLLESNEYKLTANQIYSMCLQRRCAICSRHADLHHVDQVGTKGHRDKISHIGMRMLPLCRIHHTEAHTMPKQTFIDKYYLTPIIIDAKLEYFIKRGIIKTIE